MAYIGNDPSNRFVAPKAASVFSGDGSTTAFTLDHAVGSDEDILVSVDGVIQEPSVAYAVSSGTTLTFTAAPSNNSGNNIFVYYLFRTVGTVSHPSNNALTATTGTFTGAFTSPGIDDNADATAITIDSSENVGIGTSSMSSFYATKFVVNVDDEDGITIYNDGANERSYIMFADGTSGDARFAGQISYDHNNDGMIFATGASTRATIDSNGKLLINTTSTLGSGQGVLQLKGAANNTVCGVQVNNDGEAGFQFYNQSGTEVGRVTIGSSSTGYATSSDYRLKENVDYSFDATTELKKLKPCKFNFKADKDRIVEGFLAHEVQDIVPQAITGKKDEVDENGNPIYQGIDQAKLVPLLTKSLQEAIAEIDTLKTKVAALESK